MTQLAFHPLANVFPLLEGEEFDAFVADIQASGLCEAVWLYEGQILDGRNRYRACQRLGRDCATRDYPGNDPLGFVLSMNLQRRHLDASQRAMIAARLATMRQGERTDLPSIEGKLSQTAAAELFNVGVATVERAKKVQQQAATAVTTAVDRGEMTLSAALPLTEMPHDEQPRILEAVRRESGGKKPTGTQTRAAVSRAQVVATVKEQMAAGKTPQDAVHHALEKHAITLPTPALADAIGAATDRQVTLPATDGLLPESCPKADEATAMAQTTRLFQLFNALEALATLPDLETLLAEIPDSSASRVAQYLDAALSTLTRFATLWKAHRDAEACHLQGKSAKPSPVPEVSAEPPQPRQPKQAPRRGETAPKQAREEAEDATKPTAKAGADYDTTRFYLGKLCPRAHTYRDTGHTLRRTRKGDCVQCHRES
jgi:hypothetical protein